MYNCNSSSSYSNKSSDDLYNSCSCCGILELQWWNPCILKDIIGIEPDLWWKHKQLHISEMK